MAPLTSQLKVILFLIISGAILSFTDGLAKYLTGRLVIGEIIFFRACFVFVPVVIMIWWRGGLSSLRVNSWRFQGARAVCVVVVLLLLCLPGSAGSSGLDALSRGGTALAPAGASRTPDNETCNQTT